VLIAVPHATRRIARFAAVSATLLTVLGGVAQAASAETDTQTVLTATTQTVGPGGSVRITATVYPGIFVTPSGAVTFKNTTTNSRLGKVQPGRKCLLTSDPCPMSITVRANRLKLGPNTITGAYSGDIAETPSSDSIVITRTKTATNPTVTTTCQTGDPDCETGTDTSVDGTASGQISTFNTVGATETISVSFQTTELPCSTPATGDPLVFSSTNAPSEKFVTYSVFGTAADIANQAYGTEGNVCFGSPEQFITKGFTPPVLGPDGLYYGLLPECSSNEVVPPCVESASFQPGGEGGPSEDEYTENVVVTAADPRISN
jgi:hypothetical protein